MGDVVADRENAWEEVQKKAFIHWVNTLLEQRGLNKLSGLDAFSDGVTVVTFVEILCEKRIRYVTPDPKLRIEKINNINLALEALKSQGLSSKYLTISSEDFVDNNTKFILGFLWTTFHKFRIAKSLGSLNDDVDTTKTALLDWVRKTTEGYKGVNVTDFRTSFNDGNALLALVHAYDQSLFEYEPQVSEHSSIENAELALDLSEKHMNIPRLIDPSELVHGRVDERTIMLYAGMFFNAFVSTENKKRVEAEKMKVSEKVSDLEMEMELLNKKLANKEEEYLNLCRSQEEQAKKNEELNLEYEQLVAKHQALQEEHSRLKKLTEERVNLELSALGLLRKNLLEHLRDMHSWKAHLAQNRTYESEKIQIKVNAEIAEMQIEDQINYLSTALSNENECLQSLLRKYGEQSADLHPPAADSGNNAPLEETASERGLASSESSHGGLLDKDEKSKERREAEEKKEKRPAEEKRRPAEEKKEKRSAEDRVEKRPTEDRIKKRITEDRFREKRALTEDSRDNRPRERRPTEDRHKEKRSSEERFKEKRFIEEKNDEAKERINKKGKKKNKNKEEKIEVREDKEEGKHDDKEKDYDDKEKGDDNEKGGDKEKDK